MKERQSQGTTEREKGLKVKKKKVLSFTNPSLPQHKAQGHGGVHPGSSGCSDRTFTLSHSSRCNPRRSSRNQRRSRGT